MDTPIFPIYLIPLSSSTVRLSEMGTEENGNGRQDIGLTNHEADIEEEEEMNPMSHRMQEQEQEGDDGRRERRRGNDADREGVREEAGADLAGANHVSSNGGGGLPLGHVQLHRS